MTDKPEIDFPEGEPPAGLEITDITVGDGAAATAGRTVSVHYVGVAFSTGEEFDASYNLSLIHHLTLPTKRIV